MIKVREAHESEMLKIAEMWSDFMTFNAEFNDSFSTKKKAREIFSQEMFEKIKDDSARLAVVEQDNRLAGFCYSYISLKPKFFKLEKFGFIGDLYVVPEMRRKKLGKALVDDAMAFFARNKIKQIELLVSVKNEGTIKFWQSLGFDHLLTWLYKRI
jgi:ribosomal protein S18 acetylase RimI-like enzyme